MKHYDLLFCILRLSLLEQYFNVWHNGSQVSLAFYFLIFNLTNFKWIEQPHSLLK